MAKVAAIFIADTARLAYCESERGGGHKARRMRAVDSYVYARGWRVFLFLCVSKDAFVIALRAEKHERGTKTMTATQPSEGSRRANLQRRWMWLFVRPLKINMTNIKPQPKSRW